MPISRMNILAAIVILAVATSGCRGNRPDVPRNLDAAFRSMVSIEDLNRDLAVRIIPDYQDKPRVGSTITIAISNNSNEPIYFPIRSSIVRVFAIQDEKWMQIANTVEYYSLQGGDTSVLLPRSPENSNTLTTLVQPKFPISEAPTNAPEILRILIVGELRPDDQNAVLPVGAFTDVVVYP